MRGGPAIAVCVLLTAPGCSQDATRTDLWFETDSGGTGDASRGDTSSGGSSTTEAKPDVGNDAPPRFGCAGDLPLLVEKPEKWAGANANCGEDDGDSLPCEWESGTASPLAVPNVRVK